MILARFPAIGEADLAIRERDRVWFNIKHGAGAFRDTDKYRQEKLALQRGEVEKLRKEVVSLESEIGVEDDWPAANVRREKAKHLRSKLANARDRMQDLEESIPPVFDKKTGAIAEGWRVTFRGQDGWMVVSRSVRARPEKTPPRGHGYRKEQTHFEQSFLVNSRQKDTLTFNGGVVSVSGKDYTFRWDRWSGMTLVPVDKPRVVPPSWGDVTKISDGLVS